MKLSVAPQPQIFLSASYDIDDIMASNKSKPSAEALPVSSASSVSSSGSAGSDAMDKGQLIEKVRNVPLEKLRDIITNQIDLEIRLKHKELTLTEEEVGKCESQMITLRNLLKVPREKSFDNEPNEFTIKYYDLLNRSLSVHEQGSPVGSAEPTYNDPNDYQMPTHSYRTRSTTSSLRPSVHSSKPMTIGCLYRRTDGIIVKLVCPDCQRTNFSSAQGFLNHSRIAHSREYTSQDAAALICGEILPDYEQDEEGLNSLKSLKEKGLDPTKSLNVNEIDFNGLNSTLNTVPTTSIEKSMSPLNTGEKAPPQTMKEPEPSELMKKLIKNGVTKDKDSYEHMINDVKAPVEIAAEEEDDKLEEDVSKKRRRSRVGVEDTPSPSSLNDKPPLPKIKIKLRSDDKKKLRSR